MTIEQKDVKMTADAKVSKLQTKFKETWSTLSVSDIALYTTNREQFVAKVVALCSLSKEDAEKKIHALEVECECCAATSTKAA